MLKINRTTKIKNITDYLDVGNDINEQDKDGFTILHHLVDYNTVKTMQQLLRLGKSYNLDVEIKSKDGYTAFWMACNFGHDLVIKELLKYGVDVNTVDKDDESALFYALTMEIGLNIIEMMLKKGVVVDEQTIRYINPRKSVYFDAVKELIQEVVRTKRIGKYKDLLRSL